MNAVNTHEKILDAAAREMLQHGYAGSSLSAIAARIGLTKGALTRQFPTKSQLALDIVQTLKTATMQERARSAEVYPDSGLRALIRFLLAMWARAATEPRVMAAVVLSVDRAAPSSEVAGLFNTWRAAITNFLQSAEREGELDSSLSAAELSELVFVINMGEAMLRSRTHDDPPSEPFHLLRPMLTLAGVLAVDTIVDDVLRTNGEQSLPASPQPWSGHPDPG